MEPSAAPLVGAVWGAEKGNHEDDDPFDPEPVDPEAAPDLYPPEPCDIWGKIKQEAAKERDTDILQNLRAFPLIYEAKHQPRWEGLQFSIIKLMTEAFAAMHVSS